MLVSYRASQYQKRVSVPTELLASNSIFLAGYEAYIRDVDFIRKWVRALILDHTPSTENRCLILSVE